MATTQAHPRESRCPECNHPTRTEGIETYCEQCGRIVSEDAIDHGPDWRIFDASDRSKQHAEPVDPTRQGKHLGSTIGRGDINGRLRVQHSRAKTASKRDRNHRYAAGEIERITNAVELPESVGKCAKQLYKSLKSEVGSLEGQCLDTLTATCVYTTCRVRQLGVTPDEIAAYARAEGKLIARRHTWLTNRLDVEVPPPSPRVRTRRVCNELGVSESETRRCLDTLESLPEEDVNRGSPSTLAAAIVYETIPCVTQQRVADAAGVTPAGLRLRRDRVVG